MKLILGKWQFKAGLIPSLLALFFFSLFISLGVWQLHRAEYKRTLYADFLKRNAAPAVNIEEIYRDINEKEKILWRQVKATGTFNEDTQILLDNQVERDEAGYYVYTAFKPEGIADWILVNRGWIATGADRSLIPELIKTNSLVNINGVIKDLPRTGLLLKESLPETLAKDVIRVQKLDLTEIEKLLNIKLMPVILRLEPESSYGYVREWHIPGSGEEMHLGYAFQWFAFATTLLIIYLVVNVKRLH